MINIISKILLSVFILIAGYLFMVKFSEPYEPKIGAANEPMPESSVDTDWVNQHGKAICFAGVSLRNRWGDPGQAKPGSYLQEQNGIYSYRSYKGDSEIHCAIEGSTILMSWSNKFKNDPNRYYTFKKTDDGDNVEITEHEWGTITSRVYSLR